MKVKNKFLALFLFPLIFLASCKFDQTPAGTYKGFFNVFGGAVTTPSANDGTLTVVGRPNGNFDFTLSYPGNPDITLSDLTLVKRGSPFGYIYDGYFYSDTKHVYLDLQEYNSYKDSKWEISIDYGDDTQLYTFSFYGAKESE